LISKTNWQRASADRTKEQILMLTIPHGFFFVRILNHAHAIFSEAHQLKFQNDSEAADNLFLYVKKTMLMLLEKCGIDMKFLVGKETFNVESFLESINMSHLKETFLAHKIASKEILTNLEQTEWAELVPKIGERAAIRLAISKLV